MKSNKTTKILWINSAACTPEESGPTRHYEIAKHLNRHENLKCTIASSSIHHGTQKQRISFNSLYHVTNEDGVEFIWIKSRKTTKKIFSRIVGMMTFTVSLFLTLSFKTQKYDIIVGSSPQLLHALIGYFAAKIRNSEFILEVRDIWPDSLIEIGNIPKSHPAIGALRVIEKLLYKKSDKIIGVLPGFHDYLTNFYPNKKYLYAPNFPPHKRYPYKPEPDLHLIKKNPNQFSFLYAGSHGLAQNLETIILAAKILESQGYSSIKIILVGDGFEKAKLVRLAKSLNLSNILFLSPLPKKNISEIIKQVDVCILHLKNLKLFEKGISPNKLYDYLEHGKPILFAAPSNHFPEDIKKIGLKAEPDNAPDIAKAMIEFSEMTIEKLKILGIGSKNVINDHFDAHKITTDIQKFILG